MACTKLAARKSTGGLAPRKQLAASDRASDDARAFILLGCTGYATHMNGTYVKRSRCYGVWNAAFRNAAFRCVENPRVSIVFMEPSKSSRSEDRY